MRSIFVELHEGDPNNPTTVLIAVDDIRLVRPKADYDDSHLLGLGHPEAYNTKIMFKGDAWSLFVHEAFETVCGLCGFGISR